MKKGSSLEIRQLEAAKLVWRLKNNYYSMKEEPPPLHYALNRVCLDCYPSPLASLK